VYTFKEGDRDGIIYRENHRSGSDWPTRFESLRSALPFFCVNRIAQIIIRQYPYKCEFKLVL